jgi:hypothetical protein
LPGSSNVFTIVLENIDSRDYNEYYTIPKNELSADAEYKELSKGKEQYKRKK